LKILKSLHLPLAIKWDEDTLVSLWFLIADAFGVAVIFY
jgi:hypothetical protein